MPYRATLAVCVLLMLCESAAALFIPWAGGLLSGALLRSGDQAHQSVGALLKDPPIPVLDEATTMFDPQGEVEFLQACHDSLKRRTVLLITHRPASLAVADRIVRMDHGRTAHA